MARPKAVREAAKQAEEEAQRQVEAINVAKAQGKSLDELIAEDGSEPGNEPDGRSSTPSDTVSGDDLDTRRDDRDTRSTEDLTEALRKAEERNRTLRSKYDAEVPRLSRENSELKDRITSLTGEVSDLKQRLEEAMSQPAVSDDEINAMKDKLKEDLTDDAVEGFADLARTIARQNLPKQTEDRVRSSEIEDLRKEVATLRTQSRDQQLTTLVPDWQEMNLDDGFIDWLDNNTDWASGRNYGDLLREAWGSGDVARTAQFFIKYKSANEAERQQERSPKNTDQDIQPDAAGPGDRPVGNDLKPQAKKTWTVAEIEDINQRARRGEFKGREKQLKLLRDNIARAAAERRVVQ